METISFRIWDKQNKKFHFSGSTPSMLTSFFEHTAVLNTRDEMPYQQFTGLSDMNKNWIYEGDIFRDRDWSIARAEVEFENGMFGFLYEEDNSFIPLFDCKSIEIIGNKFENPELISKNN